MTIPQWIPLVEGEVDSAKNLQKIALSIDGVVQHVMVLTAEVAALLMAKPDVTLLDESSTVRTGERII